GVCVVCGFLLFFFFQAEDGIRDFHVTGVQTCALPIFTARALAPLPKLLGLVLPFFSPQTVALFPKGREAAVEVEEAKGRFDFDRSEERRVGKEGRTRWARYHQKRKADKHTAKHAAAWI